MVIVMLTMAITVTVIAPQDKVAAMTGPQIKPY